MSGRNPVLLCLVVLLLAACGGQAASGSGGGSAANGQKLFQQATLGTNYVSGCKACHPVEAGKNGTGPSLAGVAARADSTVKDAAYKGTAKSGQEYLHESIVDPNAYVAKGFQASVMPQTYKTALKESEVNDLVAYLATLK